MSAWLLWMAEWWCRGSFYLWMLMGTALYLDRHRSTIRQIFARWDLVAVKILFAPLTLSYLLLVIAVQPIVVMWQNYAIGCYTGRGGAPIPPGLLGRKKKVKLSDLRHQRDVARSASEKERQMYGNPEAAVPPATRELSCSEAFVRNEAATRDGCNRSGGRQRILIQDEFAYRYAPLEDEEDSPPTINIGTSL